MKRTVIKACCHDGHEAELTSAEIRLHVCRFSHQTHYTFTCPTCCQPVSKPADEHVVSLLVAAGVPAVLWDIPAEVMEPRYGAALSYDDLLDFALALEAEDDLVELAA